MYLTWRPLQWSSGTYADGYRGRYVVQWDYSCTESYKLTVFGYIVGKFNREEAAKDHLAGFSEAARA
jgi:hypothetical protein